MTPMIERVARALLATDLQWGWDKYQTATHNKYRDKARAAIAAMREPTGAMVRTGEHQHNYCIAPVVQTIWQAMIDAALEEK